MEIQIPYEEGHAHVAAIRLLKYRSGRPPSLEEIAEILGSQVELTNHRLRALEKLGIVTIVENPFEAHVSVKDHLALEELPAEADESVLSEAIDEFRERHEKEASERMRQFEDADEEREQREKHEKIEDELRSYKKKPTRKAPWEK